MYEQVVEDEAVQVRIEAREKGVYRKGYLGHIVKIGHLIGKVAGGSAQVNGYITGMGRDNVDERWAKVKALVERETFEAEKNLAGYTTRKIDANNVMFHK